jgi:DNA-binding response OmpR family regulator
MKKILIVEDDEDLRKVMAEALKRSGYEVSEAKNGTEGIAALKDVDPDLVVLDLLMPEMSGIDLQTIVIGRRRKPKLIIVTALPEVEVKELYPVLEEDVFLQKPVSMDDLREQIKKLVG